MLNGKYISVGMATYNGERYIKEQLLSIFSQSVKPDEIIISDDGSHDATINIVREMIPQASSIGIRMEICQDNPKRGYAYNFAWVMKKTQGDFVFLSDQDDIWESEKIERMLDVFSAHPDALCVCHNGQLVDEEANPVDGTFNWLLETPEISVEYGQSKKIEKEQNVERFVNFLSFHGMSLCIKRELIDQLYPFPNFNGLHDWWIVFNAILCDGMYYLNLPLVKYRLHGNNTIGNSAYKGTKLDAVKRKLKAVRNYKGSHGSYLYLGKAAAEKLAAFGYTDCDAYYTAIRIRDIGEKLYKAETSGRISGAAQIYNLYKKDIRYRRSGKNEYIEELLYILLTAKRKRKEICANQ